MTGRTVDFELGGVTYPLCFTLRAVEAFYQRYDSIDGWFARLQEYSYQDEDHPGDSMQLFAETLWLLETLMKAGYERAKVERGSAAVYPPELDTMRDLLCVGDLSRARDAVIQTISMGNIREVGAQAPKNGEGADSEE